MKAISLRSSHLPFGYDVYFFVELFECKICVPESKQPFKHSCVNANVSF